MKLKSLSLIFILLLWGLNLSAVELKLDKDILTETGRYEEDYLFLGNDLKFLGETKDLFFLGENIDFSGIAKLAITGLAREINVDGNVNNGVKAAGGTIDINGNVNGTSFLAAEKVTLGKESRINGESFIAGGKIFVLGKHKGNLYAAAAEITILNEIQGDVKAHSGLLKIPDGGLIAGNLTVYHSDQKLSPEEASRVTGEISYESPEGESLDDSFGGMIWLEIPFKATFIVFGLLLLLFPVNRFLEKQYTQKEIQSYALWGLLPIFVYPSAIVFSILLLITLPVAASMLLAFMPLVFVTKTLGITMIGGYLVKAFNFKTTSRYLYFLLGGVIYSLISLIPYFGYLLLVFVSSIGCGLILFALFKKEST
ncbi:MAG: hypothetical protein OEY59_03170 [Deltaproteobacteria bacterium]|nr:hypothetical protein [Deltaproteobacteria bacterium]